MSNIVHQLGNMQFGTAAATTSLAHYGDKLTMDESWPNPGKRDYLRIFLINTNGISYFNNYLDWEMSLGFMYDMQVDIFSITKPNLDFSQPAVLYAVHEKAPQVDQYMDTVPLPNLLLRHPTSELLSRWEALSLV